MIANDAHVIILTAPKVGHGSFDTSATTIMSVSGSHWDHIDCTPWAGLASSVSRPRQEVLASGQQSTCPSGRTNPAISLYVDLVAGPYLMSYNARLPAPQLGSDSDD
jgi:hypothetical protein